MESDITISVIIPTRNNADMLQGAIKSLLTQTLPPQNYEIIIVDNGSTDNTPDVVLKVAKENTLPRIVYVQQPRPGLSLARDTGVNAAIGQWVAYIDDDALAAPDWLEAILETYQLHPDAVAVGGKVMGKWEGPIPTWFDSTCERAVSVVDWGPDIKPLRFPEWVCGTNYSVKRELVLELGGHDPNLGRRDKLRLGGEEVELQQRIEKAGLLVMYNPNAFVHHHIPHKRLTKKYYLGQQYWAGRTQYLVDQKHSKWQDRVFQPLYFLARTPRSLFLAMLYAVQRNQCLMLRRLGHGYFAVGYFRQMVSRQ